MEGALADTRHDINPSLFASSSFSFQQALECNFPTEGFVFRGGRHEVTAFCRIMALRRLPSPEVKIIVTDGKPNSKYRCGGCGNGIMTIRFGPNIVRKSSPCTCSVPQLKTTRVELLTTEFSNYWDLQAGVVGFFFDVLKIPVICIASKGPFPLSASGKGFWLKHFDGRWIHIPTRVIRKSKVSFYHVKSFPDNNNIQSAFQGQQLGASTTVASLPTPPVAAEQKAPVPEHSYRDCVCCQDKPGIYRFVCRCTDDVDCQYCKGCLGDVISTRKTQMDRMEREPIFLNFSESKKSSALTCSICREKVTEFYRCFTDPNEATRCAFPIGWLHERPFYNQDEIDVYHPVFLEKVEPIRLARSKILVEISRLTAEKDNYREEMANVDRNWSYDDNVGQWDRSIRMQEDELKKHVFPKWSLHPSSYSENDEDKEMEPPTKIRKYAEVFHVGAQEERYNAGLARAGFEEEGRHEDGEVVEVIDLSEDGPARPPG